jgi:copper resistance protein B
MNMRRLAFPVTAALCLAATAASAQDAHETHEAHVRTSPGNASTVRPERRPQAEVEGPCADAHSGASTPRPDGRCALRERLGDAPEHSHHEPTVRDADALPPSGHIAPAPPTDVMHAMSAADMVDVMGMDDRAPWGIVAFDRFEHVGGDAFAWSARASYGGDIDRLALRSEGERADGRLEHADLELLWSHAIAPFWDSQLGLRHDFGEGPDRTWAAFGVQGLAPYWFEVGATAYVGEQGRTALRAEVEYELLLTQRLVLQPRLELNAYGRRDPAARIGAGLADAEAGLRLRYEIRREFAPYIGVERHQRFGATADYARADGHDSGDTQWVVGVRFWF